MLIRASDGVLSLVENGLSQCELLSGAAFAGAGGLFYRNPAPTTAFTIFGPGCHRGETSDSGIEPLRSRASNKSH